MERYIRLMVRGMRNVATYRSYHRNGYYMTPMEGGASRVRGGSIYLGDYVSYVEHAE